jgi:hypothetical protein
MFTVAFWKDAAERAIRAASWSLMSLWGAAAGFNLLTVHWQTALGIGSGAAVLSLLASLLGGRFGSSDNASLLPGQKP